mgnify:FL=1
MIDPSTIIPLKVPSNWFVLRNNFYNLEPVEGKDGYVLKEQKFAFNFELFVLKQMIFADEEKECKNGFIIDFGWIPEAKINGVYSIGIYYEDYENHKLSFEHRDRYVMQRVINFFLTHLSEYKESPTLASIRTVVNNINVLSTSDSPLLIPLKIFSPTGVFENNFYDQSPEEVFITNNQILLKFKRGNPSEKSNKFGWIFNSFGILLRLRKVEQAYWYHLQITHDQEESALFEFQHQDRYVIQAVVNLCTEVIAYADVRDIIDDFRKKVAKTVQALEQSST